MDIADLIDSLASRRGPVLTWYGQDRTELGGPVAARWLAKTANLLGGDLAGDLFRDEVRDLPAPDTAQRDVDVPGVVPGPPPAGSVRIDLPVGWQSLVWAAAAWLSGWRTSAPGTPGPVDPHVDVWVVDHVGPAQEEAAGSGVWVLAQATTPLALSWPGDLPDGVLDALQELSAQSDALEVSPEVSPDLVVDTRGAGTRVADAGGAQTDGAGAPGPLLRAGELGQADGDAGPTATPDARVLLVTNDPVTATRQVLSHWGAGHSVVVVDPRLHDAADIARIARVERAQV